MKSSILIISAFILGRILSVTGWIIYSHTSNAMLSGANYNFGYGLVTYPEEDYPTLTWGNIASLDTKAAIILARDKIVEKIGIDSLALRPERVAVIFPVDDTDVTGLRITFTNVEDIREISSKDYVTFSPDKEFTPGVELGQFIVTISPEDPENASVIAPWAEFIPNVTVDEIKEMLRSNKKIQRSAKDTPADL